MNRSRGLVLHGLLVAGLLTGGLLATTTTANASSYSSKRNNSVKLVWRKSMHKHAMHGTKGYLYSKHLGRRYKSLKSYPKTTWYTSKHEKLVVKKDGHSKIYYYVTSGNKKHSGWIWRGYLKSGKNPKADQGLEVEYTYPDDNDSNTSSTTSKPSKGNSSSSNDSSSAKTISKSEYLATVKSEFISQLNKERTQRGLTPVSEGNQQQQVADVRMSQIMEEQPATGWVLSHDYKGKDGIMTVKKQLGFAAGFDETLSVRGIAEYTEDEAVSDANKIINKMVYDDANMGWGHQATLLSPNYIYTGVSANVHNDYLFLVSVHGTTNK